MSYVEIETGRYVKRWAFWNPATWSIPKLYWDAWSQEQRLHAICRQLEKVIKYADYLGVNVDDIAARLKAIEDGQLDELITQKIEEWFEENEPTIMQALEDLNSGLAAVVDEIGEGFTAENTIASAVSTLSDGLGAEQEARIEADEAIQTELTEFKQTQAPNNLLKGARCIFRVETDWDTSLQGGTVFEHNSNLFFAVFEYSGTVANAINIYNLQTGVMVGTVSGSFAHGNNLEYRDGRLYGGGGEESTQAYIINVQQVTDPYVEQTLDLTSLGFDNVWGFGVYKDGTYWASETLNDIWQIDENFTTRTLLCYQPIDNYITGTQQAITYNKEEDLFYSCRSNSFSTFTPEGEKKYSFSFDWHYGFVGTTEIEEVTKLGNKLYFHNNNLYRPYYGTDAGKVHALFEFDPDNMAVEWTKYDGAFPTYELDSTEDMIPNPFREFPLKFKYPQDMMNCIMANENTEGCNIRFNNEIPYVVMVPQKCHQFICGGTVCRGIQVSPGSAPLLTGFPVFTQTQIDNMLVSDGTKKVYIRGNGATITLLAYDATMANTTTSDFEILQSYGGVIVKPNNLTNDWIKAPSAYIVNRTSA